MGYLNTEHFGFTAVREQVPSTNDWSATYWNWITMDKISYGILAHTHDGRPALSNPAGTLSLTPADTGGSLLAGKTYYFVATYIDEAGLETGISAEASVAMPAAITAPAAPTSGASDLVVHTGGLQGGAYWYKLSYLRGGGETLPSNPIYINIPTNNTYKVTLNFDSLTTAANDADTIRIYRKIGSSGSYVKLKDITNTSTATYLDSGVDVPISDIHPKTTNTTNSLNKVTIDCSTLTNYADAVAVRIYVSTTSGVYTATKCLVPDQYGVSQHTIDLTDATPGVSIIYTGLTPLASGKPPAVSQTYASPSKVDLAEEVQGNLLLEFMPEEMVTYRGYLPVGDDTSSVASPQDGDMVEVLDADGNHILWTYDADNTLWKRMSIIRQAHVADASATDGTTLRDKINEILAALESAGVLATS